MTIFTEIQRPKHPEPGENSSGCRDLTATQQFQAFKKIIHPKFEPKWRKKAQILNNCHFLAYHPPFGPRHLIKGSRPQKGLNWLKSGEIFVKISHVRLIFKASCGKHGYYPSISQHIIDIYRFKAIGIYSDPYLVSYKHQKSQIEPFSAKIGPK